MQCAMRPLLRFTRSLTTEPERAESSSEARYGIDGYVTTMTPSLNGSAVFTGTCVPTNIEAPHVEG